MAEVVDVVCPAGVAEGDTIHVETADGRAFDVVLPAGVAEADTFQVELTVDVSMPAGLRAVAHYIQEARAIAASFFGQAGAEPKPVQCGEVLAEALKQILRALEFIDELDELIDGNSALFADYTRDGEQRLEWTELHQQYVALVEAGISEQLEELECTAEEVFSFARVYGGDPAADVFLSKLLAHSDYHTFCAMMQLAHVRGPMGV